MTDRRLRVMLLFGGRSAEHDVSRVTAVAVARALDPARYEVVPVAITTEGEWLFADSARRAIESAAGGESDALPRAFAVDGDTAAGLGDLVASGGVSGGGAPGTRGALDVDVVLPLLHGAVLAVRSVQQRQHDVDGEPTRGAHTTGRDQVTEPRGGVAVDGERPRQRVGLATRGRFDRAPGGVREEPLPLGGDGHRHHLVAGRVERPSDRDRGHPRHVVLGRPPAEEQHHAETTIRHLKPPASRRGCPRPSGRGRRARRATPGGRASRRGSCRPARR